MLAWALVLCAPAEIEVSATVAPLSRLLPQIGTQAGTKLVAGASVRKDILAIASPRRPIRELMDGIAEAVNAEWIESNGEWVLTRTKKQEEEDQAQEYRFRLARISDYLRLVEVEKPFTEAQAKILAERRENYFNQDQPIQNRQDLHNRSPLARFGARLASSIGAETLAKIPPSRTVVFSSQPNARQKPLPAESLGAATRAFVQEQNLYAEAIAARGTKFHGDASYTGFDLVDPIDRLSGKVLVIATARQYGLISFEILVANQRSEIVLRTQSDIRPRTSTGVLEEVEKGNNQPIEHVGWRAELRKPGPISPDLLERLESTAVNEPHALLCEAGVRTWAKVKDKPVIVLVPDLLPPYRRQAEDTNVPFSLTSFELALRVRCTVDNKPDRVVVRPYEPVLARTMRSDRDAMQTLFKKEGEFPRLASIVDFMKATSPIQAEFADRYAASFGLPNLPPSSQLPLLRLIGLGQALLPTGSITFGQMNQAQKEFARYVVYENRAWFNRDSEALRDLRSEPTEAFPADLPNDARLTVQSITEIGSVYSQYGSWFPVRLDNIDELAVEPIPDRKFRMGEFRHYTITFRVGNLPETRVLFSDVLSISKQESTLDELPEDYRQVLKERIAERRRQMGWPPLP